MKQCNMVTVPLHLLEMQGCLGLAGKYQQTSEVELSYVGQKALDK